MYYQSSLSAFDERFSLSLSLSLVCVFVCVCVCVCVCVVYAVSTAHTLRVVATSALALCV
jgi:hypothetical protein